MSNTPDITELSKRLTSYVRRAWAQLYWERYAPVFALAALFIVIFLIGAFGGLWDRLGDPWRLIALLVAIGLLIRAGLKRAPLPRPINPPRAAALSKIRAPSTARSTRLMMPPPLAQRHGLPIIKKPKRPRRPYALRCAAMPSPRWINIFYAMHSPAR